MGHVIVVNVSYQPYAHPLKYRVHDILSDLIYWSFLITGIEWVDIKHRTGVGILMSLDWSVSTAMLSLVAYFVNDWRYLTAAATVPLLLAMISWW